MKTKKVNNLADVATIARPSFQTIESTTKGGKKCIALVTDKRLSTEDFKRLMADITLAEGYGFMKFYPEQKARYITATGIDAATLVSLAGQYVWSDAEPKVVKVAKKDIAKQTRETPNTKTDTIDPKVWEQFQAFQAMLKAGK